MMSKISYYCKVIFKDGEPILIEKLDPFIPKVIEIKRVRSAPTQTKESK